LLTAVILGIGLGLIYAWVISPVEYIDTPPNSLRKQYKDQYRAMIAAAYDATGNLQRARTRLELLDDETPSLVLVAQAQHYLADGDNLDNAQALANLAAALGQVPTPVPTELPRTATLPPSKTSTLVESPTITHSQTATSSPTEVPTFTLTPEVEEDETPGPSRTPTATKTPAPSSTPSRTPPPTSSRTPTATLAPPFVLDNLIEVCNPIIGEPQLQIFVSNAAGIGIPGVEIIITWGDSEEHFFTGLKQDIDIGYADYTMKPEISYTLQVADGGEIISNLIAPQCTDGDGDSYWGSLRLIFSHP
jgi:hypothetical protein